MDGVILQVKIQNAFSHAEILVAVLNNWFLKVALEVKHLYSSD
jgi:hypothetical protein